MRAEAIGRKNITVSDDSSREKALTQVMSANRPKLTSMIRGLIRDQVEAEDVLQDVYEEFITSYDLGTAIDSVSSWLVRVARNKIFDRFRRKKTRDANKEAVSQKSETPSQPDDEWTRSRLREEIAVAIELLPPSRGRFSSCTSSREKVSRRSRRKPGRLWGLCSLEKNRYKFTLAASIVSALVVAVLWGGYYRRRLPGHRSDLQDQSMQQWIDRADQGRARPQSQPGVQKPWRNCGSNWPPPRERRSEGPAEAE